jgi:hypothetical protein
VPILGLLFLPLQFAFWVARNLVFQFMNLTTLSAYVSQYRRFAAPAVAAPFPLRVNA